MTLESVVSNVIQSIISHAESAIPREACGVLVNDTYIACRNEATEQDQFVIHPEDYASAEDTGAIQAIVHSHPYVSPEPSQADLVGCEASKLPWVIVNVPVGHHKIIYPSGYRAPLIGRHWAYGVLDCYALVRDYYKETLEIELPDYERNGHWWERGEERFVESFDAAGFVRVDKPQLHDVLLMKIESGVSNHAGIYSGDRRLMHHLLDNLSCETVYGGYWEKHTTYVLRHKSLAIA